MEIKKSHKADLEHRRPLFFLVSLVATTVVFIGILFIPFRSITDLADNIFDDYAMDLDLQANDQDDMIAAAKPQEPKPQEDATKLNKVDETTELAPEQLDQPQQTEEAKEEEEEKEEEVPPINLNEEDEETLKVIESLPQYPGGPVEFMKWLTATLKYPDQALRSKIQGKVMISFIVNTDGSLSDIKIVKNAHKLLDAEALRVARMMPKWEPGKDKGKPCRSMIAIPIVFEI